VQSTDLRVATGEAAGHRPCPRRSCPAGLRASPDRCCSRIRFQWGSAHIPTSILRSRSRLDRASPRRIRRLAVSRSAFRCALIVVTPPATVAGTEAQWHNLRPGTARLGNRGLAPIFGGPFCVEKCRVMHATSSTGGAARAPWAGEVFRGPFCTFSGVMLSRTRTGRCGRTFPNVNRVSIPHTTIVHSACSRAAVRRRPISSRTPAASSAMTRDRIDASVR